MFSRLLSPGCFWWPGEYPQARHRNGRWRSTVDDFVWAVTRIAPTHPHAGVESAFANFAVGPFASVLVRARDALRGGAA
jgi:hypothetical protein